MRMSEANTVAPMASPELPPATSCAAVFSSSPACLIDSGAPLSVAEAEAGASPRPRRVWAALARASRAAESVRAGPVDH